MDLSEFCTATWRLFLGVTRTQEWPFTSRSLIHTTVASDHPFTLFCERTMELHRFKSSKAITSFSRYRFYNWRYLVHSGVISFGFLPLCNTAMRPSRRSTQYPSHRWSIGPKKEVFPILASFGEWNVCKDPSDGACWASSKPLNTSTLQPHKAGELCRDQPRISVLFVDNNKVGQFAFDAGTNLSAQHAASLQTSINTLPLKLIQQHWAWVFSTEDDQRVISSLAKSSFAEVTFQTTNGIKATDMFSLRGFKEALTQAKVACGLLDILS